MTRLAGPPWVGSVGLSRRRTPLALLVAASAALAACGTGSSPAGAPHPGAGRHPSASGPSPSAGAPMTTTPAPSTSTTAAAPVVTVAAAPAARPFVSPIQPYNTPTPVPGDTNGQMPSSDLVWVAPNCQAYRAAAPSLGLLLATAREQGVPMGFEECYRPLSDQVAVKQSWTQAGNSACAAPVTTTPSGRPKGTSMHGWGKAADFSYAGGGIAAGSPGDRFLESTAGRFGWNHPYWARPGGSACPEAWHWEWVGDGGTQHDSSIRADVVALLPGPGGRGYASVSGLGGVTWRGAGLPPSGGPAPSALIVGAVPTADGKGYWLVGTDGGVFTHGDARYFGSPGKPVTSDPVVAMAPSEGDRGYWEVTAAGRVSAFGSAGSYGSPAPRRPVVGMAATPAGTGYWVVTADGAVYGYGDAHVYGGANVRALPAPVVGMAATPDGRGYWLAGADGAVYPFGDARGVGDAVDSHLFEPVVGITAAPDGHGYWLVAADGGLFAYGSARFYGAG